MKKIYCDIKKCLGCGSCEIACAIEHSKSKELNKAILEGPLPIKRRKAEFIEQGVSVSTGCHHCENAACVTACMSGAMYKDKKTLTNTEKTYLYIPYVSFGRRFAKAMAKRKEERDDTP